MQQKVHRYKMQVEKKKNRRRTVGTLPCDWIGCKKDDVCTEREGRRSGISGRKEGSCSYAIRGDQDAGEDNNRHWKHVPPARDTSHALRRAGKFRWPKEESHLSLRFLLMPPDRRLCSQHGANRCEVEFVILSPARSCASSSRAHRVIH